MDAEGQWKVGHQGGVSKRLQCTEVRPQMLAEREWSGGPQTLFGRVSEMHQWYSSGDHPGYPSDHGDGEWQWGCPHCGNLQTTLLGRVRVQPSPDPEPYQRPEDSDDARLETCFHKRCWISFNLVSAVVTLGSVTTDGSHVLGNLAIPFLVLLTSSSNKLYFNKF